MLDQSLYFSTITLKKVRRCSSSHFSFVGEFWVPCVKKEGKNQAIGSPGMSQRLWDTKYFNPGTQNNEWSEKRIAIGLNSKLLTKITLNLEINLLITFVTFLCMNTIHYFSLCNCYILVLSLLTSWFMKQKFEEFLLKIWHVILISWEVFTAPPLNKNTSNLNTNWRAINLDCHRILLQQISYCSHFDGFWEISLLIFRLGRK